MSALEALLGVRFSACNDILLLELDFSPSRKLVKQRQKSYIEKTMCETSTMTDDPIMYCLNRTLRRKTAKYIKFIIDNPDEFVNYAIAYIKRHISESMI